MTHPMVKRALERMMNPRQLTTPVEDDLSHLNDLPTIAEAYPNGTPFEQSRAKDAEIARLRARIAELERERDGLLELLF